MVPIAVEKADCFRSFLCKNGEILNTVSTRSQTAENDDFPRGKGDSPYEAPLEKGRDFTSPSIEKGGETVI